MPSRSVTIGGSLFRNSAGYLSRWTREVETRWRRHIGYCDVVKVKVKKKLKLEVRLKVEMQPDRFAWQRLFPHAHPPHLQRLLIQHHGGRGEEQPYHAHRCDNSTAPDINSFQISSRRPAIDGTEKGQAERA